MKAIVTGATGFIGSHLTRRLVEMGWSVHVVKRASSKLHRLNGLLDSLHQHDVDGSDFVSLWEKTGSVDVIFHLATAYGRHGQTDEEVQNTNVKFPIQLLSKAGIRVPLFIAADTCFPASYPYLQVYTQTKRHFAHWGKQWAEENSSRFVNLKLQHPFGPNDGDGKFVPWLIKQCLGNMEEIDLTSGDQEKDFIFVADVVDAFVQLAKSHSELVVGFNEFQCGTGNARTIRSFVELIHETTQSHAKLNFGALSGREGEPAKSIADTTALRSIGWYPKTSVQEGVQLTVQWYRENLLTC